MKNIRVFLTLELITFLTCRHEVGIRITFNFMIQVFASSKAEKKLGGLEFLQVIGKNIFFPKCTSLAMILHAEGVRGLQKC